MDALLLALVATLVAETGGRPQLLAGILGQRFDRSPWALAGIVLAAAGITTISALGGLALTWVIAEPALTLIYALSALFAGFGMIGWSRSVDPLDTWRIGPLLTAFMGMGILQLGDPAQFLILTTAAKWHAWPFALAGGVIGSLLALLPAFFMGARLAEILPLIWLRRIGGAALMLVGAVLALSAFGLI